ncbi:MAG: hypothetical protein V4498_04530 [candidate division FCPU426 bacterium]
MNEAVSTENIYEKVMEGVSPEVRGIVEDGLKIYAKDAGQNATVTDKVKADRLRKSFDALSRALMDRVEALNDPQMVFLCTGALADTVALNGEGTVTLLDRGVYDGLTKAFKSASELPEEADYALSTIDRARWIAMDELQALDPQATGKRRPKKAEGGAAADDPKAMLENAMARRNELIKEMEPLLPAMEGMFQSYSAGDPAAAKQGLETLRILLEQVSGKAAPVEGVARLELDRAVLTASDNVKKFAETQATFLLKLRELATKAGPKVLELRKVKNDLEGLSQVKSESRRKKFVSFDVDKIALVKRDWGYTSAFLPASAESAATRVAMSGSRILLNEHLDLTGDPLNTQLCTPEKIHASLQKILKIHVNLFPRSPSGAPIIPPFVIEPIRNTVDWMDDRFDIALVSGEPVRKGPMFSLDPAEHLVMKACGMYLSKDSIFNFRGEQNTGTFMGDYSGKVEKSAKVVFAGADKKMTMVASSKQVDAAGRDQAVADYVDFIFNVLNGLSPNPKMSKRRIAVLLRYVILQDLQNTVIMLLRYAGQTEISECRESILKHTHNGYAEAKKLVEDSWNDPQIPRILGPKPTQFMQKMFG